MGTVVKKVQVWALRTVERRRVLFHRGRFHGERRVYFADRTSLKNPRYLTEFGDKTKLFRTKEDAQYYYMRKAMAVGNLATATPIRIQVYTNYHNVYLWMKNARAWERRQIRDGRK